MYALCINRISQGSNLQGLAETTPQAITHSTTTTYRPSEWFRLLYTIILYIIIS